MRERCTIARAENRGFPLSRGQKLKRNHGGLQNSAPPRVSRGSKVCRKAKHLRQMFRRVQMLLNSSRLQLGSARARFISRLMNLRIGAMIGARDRLIVDKQKRKECICAPLV